LKWIESIDFFKHAILQIEMIMLEHQLNDSNFVFSSFQETFGTGSTAGTVITVKVLSKINFLLLLLVLILSKSFLFLVLKCTRNPDSSLHNQVN